MVKELINEYNTNKGPLQVTIDKHNDQAFNQLPQTNLYNYQFTTNEIPYKDGLMVVMNTTNLPIGEAVMVTTLHLSLRMTQPMTVR